MFYVIVFIFLCRSILFFFLNMEECSRENVVEVVKMIIRIPLMLWGNMRMLRA